MSNICLFCLRGYLKGSHFPHEVATVIVDGKSLCVHHFREYEGIDNEEEKRVNE